MSATNAVGIPERIQALRIELRDVLGDMQGINPRLSIYARLEERKKAIEKELSTLGAQKSQQ